jgi:hypothetical protein
MVGWEAGADFQIGDHLGIERFGERDAGVPGRFAARTAAGEDEHLLGAFEDLRGPANELGGRRGRNRRHVARRIDRRQRLRNFGLLHLGIEVDVDRTLRHGVGDPGAA